MNTYFAVSLLMILSLIFYSAKLFMEADWMAGVTFALVLVAVSLRTINDFKRLNNKE